MSFQDKMPRMQHDISGSGKPLVLLGGGLTGWLSWIPHAEVLAASWRVIRLQLCCVQYGLSGDPLPANYELDYEIAAFRNTLDDLDIEQADIAGWSLGGETVLSYALHNPNRVRSLTLIEPPAFWLLSSRGPLPETLLEEQKFMRTLAVNDVSEAQLVSFLRFVALVPQDVDPRSLPPWPNWLEHRQSLRVGDAAFRHQDSLDLLRAFEKPVLLVKGEGSNPELHAIIDSLADELPNAQVVTYPGGHAPHILAMQPFMDRYTRFLSDHSTSR